MNEQPTNHVERNHDSSGGRISQDRRDVTNRALDLLAIGETLARVAKNLDKAEPDRRRASLFAVVDELAILRENLRGTEDLLRMIAANGPPFPLVPEPRRPTWAERARSRLWEWLFS